MLNDAQRGRIQVGFVPEAVAVAQALELIFQNCYEGRPHQSIRLMGFNKESHKKRQRHPPCCRQRQVSFAYRESHWYRSLVGKTTCRLLNHNRDGPD